MYGQHKFDLKDLQEGGERGGEKGEEKEEEEEENVTNLLGW